MKKIFILIISLLLMLPSFSQKKLLKDTVLIFKYDIKQEIGPAVWRHTQQSFKNARKLNADLVLIHMNTYGGAVDAADSIRTEILNSEIPVYVFIDNNAASAGALISIACDRIYMRPGANIGAATVVDQSGKVVPDKYQSFMRSMMRSTAEAHGKDTIINGVDTTYKWHRDPNIAQSMVDPSLYVEGVSDTGKVLTFTTNEAISHGFCEGKAENLEEVIRKAGIDNYKLEQYKPDSMDRVIDFLINPYLASILIMIIIGGIYFELQSPGIGFPLVASVIAAIFYFAPLYLEGLAENWEIIIFVIGVVLIALEIFVIPGFGVAGVSGITLVIFGLTLSMVDNVDFEFTALDIAPIIKALFIVMISFLMSLILSIWFANKLVTSGVSPLKPFVLDSIQKREKGFIAIDNSSRQMIGKEGIADTILRPSGKVRIDDLVYDAKSLVAYIDKGEAVLVVRFEHGQLYVKKVPKIEPEKPRFA
ncbi:MAG: NfeD family protein [Bacteroidota bacterium]|nr:NfeD family protein [Bacteroidota bacterium]